MQLSLEKNPKKASNCLTTNAALMIRNLAAWESLPVANISSSKFYKPKVNPTEKVRRQGLR